MPGIGEILAAKEARESQRAQKERLQHFKAAALAKQQQMRESANAAAPLGVGPDSDDDDLDVVPDTMHSVAREEAAARAAAGRTRPSAGRTAQLRLAGIAASPQRNAALPHIPATNESPEKRMAVAAQPSFLSSLTRGKSAAAGNGNGKRSGGMTKAELQRMVLHSAEAQSEQLRREKEEEWVRRGGRVMSVIEAVGEEKVQALIGEALRRSEGLGTQDEGDDDVGSDDDDDPDYVPVERGSASPQPTKSQDHGDDEDEQMPAEEKTAHEGEHPDDGIAEAAAAGTTEADSETETSAPDAMRVHHRPRTARPRRAIIGSDDEDDGPSTARHTEEEDVHPPFLSLPDLPSPAFTSTASPWPTGNIEPDHEHENDPDVSGNETDKENRAVVRRGGVAGSAPAHGARVLFDDILSARAGTRAAVQPLPLMQPSVLPADDDPFAFTPLSAKAGEDALRRLVSPTPRNLGKRGLSQMFEEEEGEEGAPVPALVIQGVGDSEGATPGDADPGLVGFKPILGGLSQAFEVTQVTYSSPAYISHRRSQ
jgi:mediator of replication checkpoint protein 1